MQGPTPETIIKLRYMAEHPGQTRAEYAKALGISRPRIGEIQRDYADYVLPPEEEGKEVSVPPTYTRPPTSMPLSVPGGYEISWAKDYSWCNIYVQAPFGLTLISALFGPTQAKINMVIKLYEERIKGITGEHI